MPRATKAVPRVDTQAPTRSEQAWHQAATAVAYAPEFLRLPPDVRYRCIAAIARTLLHWSDTCDTADLAAVLYQFLTQDSRFLQL